MISHSAHTLLAFPTADAPQIHADDYADLSIVTSQTPYADVTFPPMPDTPKVVPTKSEEPMI